MHANFLGVSLESQEEKVEAATDVEVSKACKINKDQIGLAMNKMESARLFLKTVSEIP